MKKKIGHELRKKPFIDDHDLDASEVNLQDRALFRKCAKFVFENVPEYLKREKA